MELIAPHPEAFELPDGWTVPVYAADQPQYNPLPCIRTLDGKVISQWRPSDEELKQLFAGEPITLVLHTFNQPLQPIQLFVGGADLS